MRTSTCLLLIPPKPPSTSSSMITQTQHHHHHSQLHKSRINQTPPSSFSISKPSSSPQTRISAALKSNPKGFGSPQPRRPKKKIKKQEDSNPDYDNDEEEDETSSGGEGIIPEVVTNRMMKRVAFTVGVPLFTGLLFFPFFYYLKVGLKIDVPTWIPFIVSFFFFGSALVGVSYGIVSSSWDPLREGSLLGWNEAQKNWPVFWQSFRGGAKSTK